MDTPPRRDDRTQTARFEPPPAGQHRLARDIDMIANTRAPSAAERVVSSHEARARTNSLGTDRNLPALRSDQ